MFKHVSKRLKRSDDVPLVDEEDSASSSSASSRSSSPVSDGSDAPAIDLEGLEEPLVGEVPDQRCSICPLKRMKAAKDAEAHLLSADHKRRRARVEAFLISSEGRTLAVNYDLEGIVALLDERAEAERPPRPAPRRKRRTKEDGKRQRVGSKPGKKQREAMKQAVA